MDKIKEYPAIVLLPLQGLDQHSQFVDEGIRNTIYRLVEEVGPEVKLVNYEKPWSTSLQDFPSGRLAVVDKTFLGSLLIEKRENVDASEMLSYFEKAVIYATDEAIHQYCLVLFQNIDKLDSIAELVSKAHPGKDNILQIYKQ